MEVNEYIVEVLKNNSSSTKKMSGQAIAIELNQLLYDRGVNKKEEKKYDPKAGVRPIKAKPSRQTVQNKLEKLVGFSKEDYKKSNDWESGIEFISNNDKRIHAQIFKKGNTPYLSNFWYESYVNISDEELKYLVDSVLYSKIIRLEDAKNLVKRIIDLSGKELNNQVPYRVDFRKETYIGTAETLKNVYTLQTAITNKKKVKFMLNIYYYNNTNISSSASKIKMKPCWYENRTVSPYQIIMSNGRYYLMASDVAMNKNKIDGEKDLKYKIYRVDLITGLEILKNQRAISKDEGGASELQYISKYVVENPYMFSEKVQWVTIRVNTDQFTQIVDWFGDNFVVVAEDVSSNTIDIKVKVNLNAFKYWVLQYSTCVKVIDPPKYRKLIKEIIQEIAQKYE